MEIDVGQSYFNGMVPVCDLNILEEHLPYFSGFSNHFLLVVNIATWVPVLLYWAHLISITIYSFSSLANELPWKVWYHVI